MKNNSIFWTMLKRFFTKKQGQDYLKKSKKMTFENNGRSGYAIFWDGYKTTRFYMELGGGDCIFYLDIPSPKEWSSHTGYALNQRDDILKFIAEESLRLQANHLGSYYKIEDKYIAFYQK
jgi:hypothetical protein